MPPPIKSGSARQPFRRLPLSGTPSWMRSKPVWARSCRNGADSWRASWEPATISAIEAVHSGTSPGSEDQAHGRGRVPVPVPRPSARAVLRSSRGAGIDRHDRRVESRRCPCGVVPDVARGGSGPLDDTTSVYQAAALSDPQGVSVVDTGVFIRDGSGRSQWRMPCIPRESGCGLDGTVAVLWPGDQMHFCADPDWIAHNQQCAPEFAGGERRVAAVIATAIIDVATSSQRKTPKA